MAGGSARAIDHVGLAEELRDAERRGVGMGLPTERFPGFTWEDARAVARVRDELRRADGDELLGYKLGWTSSAMREALGIERPNWGTLWRSQLVEGPLRLAELIHPKIEPELVCLIGSGAETGTGPDDAGPDPDSWALGLEVVDPRYPSFEFDWLDNTADNSSCARIVVGRFGPIDDPAQATIEFGHGAEVRTGVGADAMGSPVNAVAWLRGELAAEGEELCSGQLVFTGGLARPFDLTVGSFSCRSASDALDPVELTAV